MKHRTLLATLAVLCSLLFLVHVIDDMVRGFDRVGRQNAIGILILVVWLYAALVAVEKTAGLVIVLLGGLFATGVAVLHFGGTTVGSREFAASPGAYRFLWTLWALGTTGTLSATLATLELWRRRRGAPRGNA